MKLSKQSVASIERAIATMETAKQLVKEALKPCTDLVRNDVTNEIEAMHDEYVAFLQWLQNTDLDKEIESMS